MAKSKAAGYPPQIKYIVGNEGCERYSYYGMRSILIVFMTQFLLMERIHATEVMHLFMGVCYLLPLAGAYIADRFWGRYKTILYLSLFYCAGHATLAIFEKYEYGLYAGLGLIALGAGGIKPCVSAFVGDQFAPNQKEMLSKVYSLFYWMINFGSFFSTILTPLTLKWYGPTVAFGIPGILMLIATLVFWFGTRHYVRVPPSGPDPDSFWSILTKGIYSNLKLGTKSQAVQNAGLGVYALIVVGFLFYSGLTAGFVAVLLTGVLIILLGLGAFWKYVQKNHSAKRVEEFKIALSIAKVFATVTVFWALFDQHASTWVLQAEKMVRQTKIDFFGWTLFEGEILSSQFSALNPVFVMVMIPIFTYGIYPLINKFYPLTPLRKMGWGFMMAAIGFATVGLIQFQMDQGIPMHIYWQTIPYVLMTAAEVMISITGLEFAYTQAPKSMKSVIMSFWLLTVFLGNLLTAIIVKVKIFDEGTGGFFMLFAGLIFLAGLLFAALVRNHPTRDVMQT